MNQNFGLVPAGDVLILLLKYCILTIVIGLICRLLLKDNQKAFLLSFFILIVYFLFGAFKDFAGQYELLALVTRYSVLLPIIVFVLVFIFIRLKRSRRSFIKVYQYSVVLLLSLAGIEIILLTKNIYQDPVIDYGDANHELIKNVSISDSAKKPTIFWIILDEYSASSTLKAKWAFQNPLDSQLRSKGFFVADSATSPYNYTHFSLASTLDMKYLSRLQHGSQVDYSDMVFGTKTLYENNVIEFLRRNGYGIYNLSIFDIKDHPALPLVRIRSDPTELISSSTLISKVERDIAWNFYNFFADDKKAADLAEHQRNLKKLAEKRYSMIKEAQQLVKQSPKDSVPSLYMLHYMMTHDPFLFNADGSFNENASDTSRALYLSSVIFTNNVINELVDSILSSNNEKEFMILVQSDHGFRFEEYEPEFEKETCKIYYAVYCSDGDYSLWRSNISAVNGFRIIFNKYFNTSFPLLPSKTHILRYRQIKNK